MAQLVECLLGKHNNLSLVSNIHVKTWAQQRVCDLRQNAWVCAPATIAELTAPGSGS